MADDDDDRFTHVKIRRPKSFAGSKVVYETNDVQTLFKSQKFIITFHAFEDHSCVDCTQNYSAQQVYPAHNRSFLF